jgi:chorismate lyase / 3-hydroxybenzoate synthase
MGEDGHLHRCLSAATLAGSRNDPTLLGASWLGPELPAELAAAGLPLQHIRAPLLDGGGRPAEAWFGARSCRDGMAHGVHFRCDGQLLFGVISLAEEAGDGASPPLQVAGQRAYESLFRVLAEEGYPHLWRVWNYLDDINGTVAGLERYRHFNIGRHQAFDNANRLQGCTIPAASALGVAGGPLSIAFLAARTACISLENPRQLSAYRYPADYGPRSPTFSRAALARIPGQEWLFVSGTASIVGHLTVHQGDPAAQTREIIANLEALLAEAGGVSTGPAYRLDELSGRAYVRHPEHLAAVQAELVRALGAHAPIVYVQADVCRADLLVELEAQACHLFV